MFSSYLLITDKRSVLSVKFGQASQKRTQHKDHIIIAFNISDLERKTTRDSNLSITAWVQLRLRLHENRQARSKAKTTGEPCKQIGQTKLLPPTKKTDRLGSLRCNENSKAVDLV